MPKVSDVFSGNYLKAEDLNGKTVKVKIEDYEILEFEDDGKKKKKPVLKFEGKEKRLVANSTNCQLITDALGTDEIDDWIGKTITLHTERVVYGNKRVQAIRVKLDGSTHTPTPPSPADDGGDPDW